MSARLIQAASAAEVASARALFEEYARSIEIDLCFQSFEQELAALPGDYAPPRGRLLLALDGEGLAGCGALRPLAPVEEGRCEMKRLYVRPEFRGRALGRALATRLVDEARSIGYARMFLDTLATMTEAIALYRSLGFRDTAPYRFNPSPDVVYLALELL